MSSSNVVFSAVKPNSSVELQELISASRRAAPRRRDLKRSRKSEVASSALVAAMIGAQFAEEAQASEDLAGLGGDFSLFRTVRICSGHVGFETTEGADADHHAVSGIAPDATTLSAPGHGGHAFDANLHSDFSASAGAARILQSGAHASHLNNDFSTPRNAARGPRNVDDNETTTDVGHSHDGSTTGTTTDAAGGSSTGSTSATGGHTHAGSGTTSSSTTSTGVPHPTDLAMQKEHIATMNLVPVSAATHVAVNNGSWFDPNTWANGQVPGDGAKVLIPTGVIVDYDGQSTASIFTVRVDGELDFATDVDTFLEVDTFVVTATGTLTIGSEGNPVDPNVDAVISFADNGPINVAWDPMLLSRGLISHGTVDIHGAEKDAFLKVAVDPLKGDTTLTLEGPPSGWQVGDKLVLTGTHLASTAGIAKDASITANTQDEELVITAINGNVITLDHALQYNHEAPRADLKAYVANYSRNVTFETENANSVPVHQRGHVMLMHSDDITVKYAGFDELGRTDKSVRSFDVGSLSSTAPDTNVQGRYSLHIHRAGVGDQEHPAIVEGNAVWGSPGWGFVHHDSNAILSNNAAYDVFGAAFVAESGNETGRWEHNIAIKSLGVNHITKEGADVNAFDLGRTGTGFWFQGRLVEAVDNVAASVPSGAGFTYFHRGVDPNHLMVDPSTSNLEDSLRYLDSVRANEPVISVFQNNESLATQTGLEIIKANPRQDTDLRSVIDGFLAWEVKIGVHLEYTGHYTLKDLDVVASDTRGIGNNYTVGLDLSNNVFDVVVNNANIEGFYTGVRQAKLGISGLDFMNGKDQWDYVYIDVNVTGATTAFTNKTPGDKYLTATDLTDGRLLYNSAFAETHIVQSNGVHNLLGTKTDSIGQTSSYKIWDPNYIDATELRGSIEQNGYWTTADGRRVALIEEYVADRATGDVIKVGLFVEIPSSYVLHAGRFTRIEPAYNGILDQNSKAPVAVDDVASVQQGHAVVIDVLGNDADPDGDSIQLDGLFGGQHGRIVANQDGTVTYIADSQFTGTDTFFYFVQDDNGDITKAQVTVTVDV
ncbi:MAG: Ig-like domain-containing protein [Pseudomonadota bacterium]